LLNPFNEVVRPMSAGAMFGDMEVSLDSRLSGAELQSQIIRERDVECAIIE